MLRRGVRRRRGGADAGARHRARHHRGPPRPARSWRSSPTTTRSPAIANRRRITGWLAECAARPGGAALLLVDIDNFKDINDLRGHAVGDRVIREVAHAIKARLGPDVLLGRLGGDEFAVIVPNATAGVGDGAGRDPVRRRRPRPVRRRRRRCGSRSAWASRSSTARRRTSRPRSPTPTSRSTRRNGWAATGRACSRPSQYQEAARRVSVLQRVGGRAGRGHDEPGRAADRRPRHRPAPAATSCSSACATGSSPTWGPPSSCPPPSAPTSCCGSTGGWWSGRSPRWPRRGPGPTASASRSTSRPARSTTRTSAAGSSNSSRWPRSSRSGSGWRSPRPRRSAASTPPASSRGSSRARAAASPSTTSARASPRSPTSRTCRSRRSRSRGSSCGRPTPTPSTAR